MSTAALGDGLVAAAPRVVLVQGLILPARIGVYASEHGVRQRIRVSLELEVADPGGVGTDELARVVDYAAVTERVRAIVDAGHIRLVETLAERLACAMLEDSRIAVARVRVEKLDILPDGAFAGVEVSRRR